MIQVAWEVEVGKSICIVGHEVFFPSEPAIEEQAVPGQPPLSQWALFRRPASFGWLDAIILVALVIAFLAPRLASLGRFVTADEPTWGKRAASFYYALAAGDFANTYQTGHPGVTTMWAGALAYRLKFHQYRDVGQVEPFIRRWKGDELITPAVGPHAAYTCSEETLLKGYRRPA